MNIELKPVYESDGVTKIRGDRSIVVDGEAWGQAHCVHHASRGTVYYFSQEGAFGAICDPDELSWNGSPRRILMTRESTARRRWQRNDIEPAVSLEDQLLIQIRLLISRNLLRHPRVDEAEQVELKAKLKANRLKQEAAEKQRDLDTARALIEAHYDGPEDLIAAIAVEIKKAREYA